MGVSWCFTRMVYRRWLWSRCLHPTAWARAPVGVPQSTWQISQARSRVKHGWQGIGQRRSQFGPRSVGSMSQWSHFPDSSKGRPQKQGSVGMRDVTREVPRTVATVTNVW